MLSRLMGLAAITLIAACANPVVPETAGSPDPGTTVAPESSTVELPPLPGEADARPTGVNGSGRVVGTSGDRPVVWNAGVPAALDMPAGAHARQSDLWINDQGTIAGSILVDGSLGAAVWDDGDLTMIDALPGHVDSRATGLSKAGHVSGISYSEGVLEPIWRTGNRGFVWYEGETTSLPPLPDHDVSLAFGVNSSGVVLGVSVNSLEEAPRFVLWQDGEIVWAQESGDPHAWYFLWVGITDSGDAFVRTDSEDELWRWRDGAFDPYPYDQYDPPRWARAVTPGGLVLGREGDDEGVWISDDFLVFDPARVTRCSALSDGDYVVCEGPEYAHPFLARLAALTMTAAP